MNIAAVQNHRADGVTLRKMSDCLIDTLCITQGHTLLRPDRNFDPIKQHLGLHAPPRIKPDQPHPRDTVFP